SPPPLPQVPPTTVRVPRQGADGQAARREAGGCNVTERQQQSRTPLGELWGSSGGACPGCLRGPSAILPADPLAGPVALEVDQVRGLSPVQILDGVVEALLGVGPGSPGQGVIEPAAPAHLLGRAEDDLLILRRLAEALQDM